MAIIDQNGLLSLVTGKDYFAADGQELDFTDTLGAWPDLTAATVTISIFDTLVAIAVITQAGTIPTPSGANKKVRFELAAAVTALLTAIKNYHYTVTAVLASGHAPPPLARGIVTTSLP